MARFPLLSRTSLFSRKSLVGAVAGLAALGTLAEPGTASAGKFCPGCNVAQLKGQMIVGAAVLGGLAVGAIAASAAHGESYGACYLVRRQAVDEFGNYYVRRVRVCQ